MKKEKTKKSKILKAVIGVAAAGAITLSVLSGCALIGNPSVKRRVGIDAQKYIEQTYPGRNFEISDIRYDIKSVDYIVTVQSPDSADTKFYLTYNRDGSFGGDDYDIRPAENTRSRFRNAVNDDLVPALEKEFETESGRNSFAWVYFAAGEDDNLVANYLDVPVDLDNFPFEIGVEVAVYAGEKTDEKIDNIIGRIDKTVNGKYNVSEYTIYFYPDGGGQPEYVNIPA